MYSIKATDKKKGKILLKAIISKLIRPSSLFLRGMIYNSKLFIKPARRYKTTTDKKYSCEWQSSLTNANYTNISLTK